MIAPKANFLLDAARSWKATTRWSLDKLSQLGGEPLKSNAKILLTDVSFRLAGQHAICTELMEQVSRLTKPCRDRFPSTSTSPSNVIRAVNQPVQVSLKQHLRYHQLLEQEQANAHRHLHNLRALHKDTHQLTQGLLNHEKLLERFTKSDQHLVAATMEQVRSRHAMTVETLADVCIELRHAAQTGGSYDTLKEFDAAVETFLEGRLGVQLLCDHYVALDKGKPNGGVSVDCSLHDVLDDAVTEARHMCDANLNTAPEVIMPECNHQITLVRPWVHHALVELLKNAMKSSVDRAETQHSSHSCPPPIYVHSRKEGEFLSVHVIDQGLGLSDDGGAVDKAFGFAYSSAIQRWDRLKEQQSYATVRSPLQSLGVGLPLSRMMMRHFGGDLTLRNRQEADGLASGCTAVVSLRMEDTVLERLPGDTC